MGKSFSFWCKLIVGVVFFSVICLFGQKVNATDYHVGTTQTYTTLEALRTATITWDNNDKIILHNDDSSLADAFDFNGKRIIIDGIAKISPSTNKVRFSYASNETLLTIADGSSIIFDGFSVPSNYGVIYSYNYVTISGTNSFSNNDAYQGGVIYNYNSGNVMISGTNTFSNNTAGLGGGAILNNSKGDVTISGTSIFSDNTATIAYGGAIYSNGKVTISDDSTFSNNKASIGGGAIFGSGNVMISGISKFSENTTDYHVVRFGATEMLKFPHKANSSRIYRFTMAVRFTAKVM